VVLAYVCGHIVAHFSSFLYEHVAVSRLLKRPYDTLMGGTPRWRLHRVMFPNFCRPLPDEIQLRVNARMQSRSFSGRGEGFALYLLTRTDGKHIDQVRGQPVT